MEEEGEGRGEGEGKGEEEGTFSFLLPLLSLHMTPSAPRQRLPGTLWGRPRAAALTPAGFLSFP